MIDSCKYHQNVAGYMDSVPKGKQPFKSSEGSSLADHIDEIDDDFLVMKIALTQQGFVPVFCFGSVFDMSFEFMNSLVSDPGAFPWANEECPEKAFEKA